MGCPAVLKLHAVRCSSCDSQHSLQHCQKAAWTMCSNHPLNLASTTRLENNTQLIQGISCVAWSVCEHQYISCWDEGQLVLCVPCCALRCNCSLISQTHYVYIISIDSCRGLLGAVRNLCEHQHRLCHCSRLPSGICRASGCWKRHSRNQDLLKWHPHQRPVDSEPFAFPPVLCFAP